MDEIARWQQAIYELCKKHKPDVDGSGSDGDELDLTLAEINEVFIMYQDKIDEMKNDFKTIQESIRNIPTYHLPGDAKLFLQRIENICEENLAGGVK